MSPREGGFFYVRLVKKKSFSPLSIKAFKAKCIGNALVAWAPRSLFCMLQCLHIMRAMEPLHNLEASEFSTRRNWLLASAAVLVVGCSSKPKPLEGQARRLLPAPAAPRRAIPCNCPPPCAKPCWRVPCWWSIHRTPMAATRPKVVLIAAA